MLLVNSRGSMTFRSKHAHVTAPAYMHRSGCTALEMLTAFKNHQPLLVLEGGMDINPKLYGEENLYSYYSDSRDADEIALFNAATELDIPILGICRGHQLLAAMYGGTLFQDLETQATGDHPYEHKLAFSDAAIELGFAQVQQSFPSGPGIVNSLHHQGIKRMPENGVALAQFNEIIEAVKYPRALGVQWHPELAGHLDLLDYLEIMFYDSTE